MMQRLKSFRLLLMLAAMVFVAKPFMGFAVLHNVLRPRQVHTILVKSFSKRKPENLEDAKDHIESLHQLLSNPLSVLLSAISVLLLTLFPLVFLNGVKLTQNLLYRIRYALIPPEHTYLLTGKLTI